MNQRMKFSAPCCENLTDILLLLNSLYSVFSVRSVVSFCSRLRDSIYPPSWQAEPVNKTTSMVGKLLCFTPSNTPFHFSKVTRTDPLHGQPQPYRLWFFVAAQPVCRVFGSAAQYLGNSCVVKHQQNARCKLWQFKMVGTFGVGILW